MSSASKGRASICDFHEKNKVQYIIQKMPANVSPCIPVRVKMRLQAAMLWAILSIPSILVTIILFISTNKSEFKEVSTYYMFYKVAKTNSKYYQSTYTLILPCNIIYLKY